MQSRWPCDSCRFYRTLLSVQVTQFCCDCCRSSAEGVHPEHAEGGVHIQWAALQDVHVLCCEYALHYTSHGHCNKRMHQGCVQMSVRVLWCEHALHYTSHWHCNKRMLQGCVQTSATTYRHIQGERERERERARAVQHSHTLTGACIHVHRHTHTYQTKPHSNTPKEREREHNTHIHTHSHIHAYTQKESNMCIM